MFLLPGMVITLYVTGELANVLTEEHQAEMRRYLINHQNEDGGYGLHIEGHSTMFGTSLSYVTLRLLGMQPESDTLVAARRWMHQRGTALNVPSWGKFWLAVLGTGEEKSRDRDDALSKPWKWFMSSLMWADFISIFSLFSPPPSQSSER